MVLGLAIAAAVVGGAMVGTAAVGLGVAAASKIGAAYGRTVEEVYEEQRLADYYNRQAYYQHASRPNYQHYYQPNGYHQGGYSYGYRR
jgi:hypothetical protein